MKKVLFGGFILVSGAILFSVGTLGLADVNVQAQYMLMPQYLGAAAMVAGALLGAWGLKNKE